MRDAQNFNISQEQEQEIKDHIYKEVKDYKYWSYFYESKIQKEIIIQKITLEEKKMMKIFKK